MRNSNTRHILIAMFAVVLLLSCNRNTVFQDMVAIPYSSWDVSHIILFETDMTDTLQLYEISLLIRNTTDYPYSNLFLFLDIIFPDNRMLRDTVECILAHKDGKWTGRGFGKIRSNEFLFRDEVWFPVKGTYSFRIQHGMRDTLLTGVSDVGIRIDKK